MQVAGEEKFFLGSRLRNCCEVELPFGRRMNQVFFCLPRLLCSEQRRTHRSLFLKFALLYLSCRITGAKGDRNIHASVSEQLKKNFAKSRWKVSENPSRGEIAVGDPSSLGGDLPMQGVESRDCSLKPTLPRDTVFRERERCCSAVLSPFRSDLATDSRRHRRAQDAAALHARRRRQQAEQRQKGGG